MRISFIGMSNIGKSTWAERVCRSMGMPRFNCDALIETKLGDQVIHTGARGARDLAAWMGQPYEARYAENSGRYMEYEQEVLQETFALLRDNPEMPAVIDTTGSVIYTSDALLAALRDVTRIVYLEASDAHTDIMFQKYNANPKPLIWGDSYAPLPGETPQQSLKRCYPALLRERAARYKALAHITIPFEIHKDHKMDMGKYLLDVA